jgi:hypothetical protein
MTAKTLWIVSTLFSPYKMWDRKKKKKKNQIKKLRKLARGKEKNWESNRPKKI